MTLQNYPSDKCLAERYGVHRGTIWRWAKAGQLPKPIRINGCTRWTASAILAWEEKQGGNAK